MKDFSAEEIQELIDNIEKLPLAQLIKLNQEIADELSERLVFGEIKNESF